MHLTGLHHLTAITARAADNAAFYTRSLGLRLVKKTVNQDDVSAYHLFYADGVGAPGTDMTFFDWPAPSERRGTNSISPHRPAGCRVSGEGTIDWWREHLARAGRESTPSPVERDGRLTLDFEDRRGPAPDAGGRWRRSVRCPSLARKAPCRPSTRSAASARSGSA